MSDILSDDELIEQLSDENKALREQVEAGWKRLDQMGADNIDFMVKHKFYNPETHVAVPREPTDAMCEAGQKYISMHGDEVWADDFWAAMITAEETERRVNGEPNG